MIKSADNKCFVDLLNPNSQENKIYQIPPYQRPYAWTKNNCEDLYTDIMENDAGYFVGSMITVIEPDTKTNMIIDGQQRFTTLSLFLIAIYQRIIEEDMLKTEEELFSKVTLRQMLITTDKKPKLILQLEQNNKDDYEYLINNFVVRDFTRAKPNNFGNRRIGTNFKLISEFLKEKTKEELLVLLDKIEKLVFVSIEVEDYQNAYQLFEAMNNRGLALTPVDLIKNLYIAKTNDGTGWTQFVQLLGDDPRDQEQFFRYNYNAFRGEYNEISDYSGKTIKYAIGPKAIKTNIIKIYQEIIKKKGAAFVEEAKVKAEIYRLMLGLSEDTENELFSKKFADFRNAKSTGAFILLMYLYYYQIPFNMNDDELLSIFDKVLVFFIRRNLTNNPGTGAIPGILMNIIEDINRLEESQRNYENISKLVADKLRQESSSDERVIEVLNGNMYLDNRDMTRFLLCRYEESYPEAKEKKIDLWSYSNNKYVWTIEHIFPEGDNIPDEWVSMIANGDKDLAKQYLDSYCHKLGNLTMTGYNSELTNYAFETKKNLTKGDEKVGYNNGLHLNKMVFDSDVWTIEKITERTEYLVGKIMEGLVL